MDVVIVLSIAAIPLSVLIGALRDRSLRRRSRFWSRFAGLVLCMAVPWIVGLVGPVGADVAFILLLIGLGWALVLVALAPVLLFRAPDRDPGPSDDEGPGHGPEDDWQPPDRPLGGIPLADAKQPETRVRGPHAPRRAAPARRPARDPERRPVRLFLVRPWPSPGRRALRRIGRVKPAPSQEHP